MRKVLAMVGMIALGASIAQATDEVFAVETGTIQVAGPRPAPNGDNFFNIEGLNFAEANRSYGVARWDLNALRAALNTQYGTGNWAVQRVELLLTQSNAAFSATGGVSVFYTTDDTTDIKTNASPLTYPFFDGGGAPDMPIVESDPLQSYTFTPVATGTVETYTLFNSGDTGQRAAFAADIAGDASGKVTLAFVDGDAFVAATYRGQASAPGVPGPRLRIEVRAINGNNPPKANAGVDQSVTDVDQNGSESVSLNGSASVDTDGSIVSYVWTENAVQIATGATPSVSLAVGTHTITLTVTDNGTATDTDTVQVTVLAGNIPPVADAGANFEVTDADLSGAEMIALNGTGSFDQDDSIASYEWSEYYGGVIGTTAILNVNAAVGTHTYKLKVTDQDGATDIDVVTVRVLPGDVIAGTDFDFFFDVVSSNITPPVGTLGTAGVNPASGFQVFQRNLSPSIPFALLDDTNAGFPTDNIGLANSKKLDAFFGVTDLRDNATPTPLNPSGTGVATWTFDISGYTSITVQIDMAAMGNFEVTGTVASPRDYNDWTASVDGGTPFPIFTSSIDEAATTTYVLESGRIAPVADSDDPMYINGVQLSNVFRTYAAAIPGSGSQLTITLSSSSDGTSECYAFDNVYVTGRLPGGCPGGNQCDQGDVDSDCDVDLTDLAVLLAHFGTPSGATRSIGDLDNDGDVDLTDLARLLSVFGLNCL